MALADRVTTAELQTGLWHPAVGRLREVSATVAGAVMNSSQQPGLRTAPHLFLS
jgi:hypothetical protein